jgi:hypothetical protein
LPKRGAEGFPTHFACGNDIDVIILTYSLVTASALLGVHRMRNLSHKVPPVQWPEVKAEIVEVRDASSYRQGKKLVENFIK